MDLNKWYLIVNVLYQILWQYYMSGYCSHLIVIYRIGPRLLLLHKSKKRWDFKRINEDRTIILECVIIITISMIYRIFQSRMCSTVAFLLGLQLCAFHISLSTHFLYPFPHSTKGIYFRCLQITFTIASCHHITDLSDLYNNITCKQSTYLQHTFSICADPKEIPSLSSVRGHEWKRFL